MVSPTFRYPAHQSASRRVDHEQVSAANGGEFHSYKAIEAASGANLFFATSHHSWERGTNKDTNGLIRQHAP
jgi:IS30 family transposase